MRTEDGSYVGGEANSFILMTPDNHTIYFTGDTALHGDMQLINDFYKPDICLLCMAAISPWALWRLRTPWIASSRTPRPLSPCTGALRAAPVPLIR